MTPNSRKKRRERGGLSTIFIAVAAIVLVAGALAFYVYSTRGASSNIVYCGVFQYLEFPGVTINGAHTSSIQETVTTAVSFTTSTSIAGRVGQTYSNSTSTTIVDTIMTTSETAGVETICKYIADTSQK